MSEKLLLDLDDIAVETLDFGEESNTEVAASCSCTCPSCSCCCPCCVYS
ncbi:MAG: hypothetical protein L0I24_00015 [Pseudonocardia sp.]|nr:hypothetical protein [Pseudonocardia sp.]